VPRSVGSRPGPWRSPRFKASRYPDPDPPNGRRLRSPCRQKDHEGHRVAPRVRRRLRLRETRGIAGVVAREDFRLYRRELTKTSLTQEARVNDSVRSGLR